MRSSILAALLLVPAPLPAQNMSTVFQMLMQEQGVDRTTQADEIQFKRDESNRMTVPVRVSGTGPWRFLVDTGADRTAISATLAESLGLRSDSTAEIHTVTGVQKVETATVPDLQLSNQTMRDIQAPLLDAEKMGADGILGVDSLRSQRVEFDFQKNTMSIVPADARSDNDPNTIVVYGKLRNGRLIVTNAVADKKTITVVLDTGSEVCVGNEALRRALERGQVKQTGPVQLESVTGGTLDGEYTFVSKLTIGDVGFNHLAVVFAKAHTFHDLGLDDRPALLLGMNAMHAFKKVSIDFEHKRLRVLLPEEGSIGSTLMAAR